MSVNKAIIVGNLGADPELRYTQSGQAVANLRIATNRKWKNKEGELEEDTQWHRVVVWGRQAENCEKYLSKGRQVYVEGRIETNEWEDRDGNRRWTTEIVARDVQFLSGGGPGGPSYDSSYDQSPSQSQSQGQPGPEAGFDQSFNDDDIPF